MAEYIEREKVMDALLHEQYGYLCEDAINSIPAADVRPVVRGKWISQRDGETVVKLMYGEPIDSCFCSVCHEWLVASDAYDVKGNFCPNCGADMRPTAEEFTQGHLHLGYVEEE